MTKWFRLWGRRKEEHPPPPLPVRRGYGAAGLCDHKNYWYEHCSAREALFETNAGQPGFERVTDGGGTLTRQPVPPGALKRILAEKTKAPKLYRELSAAPIPGSVDRYQFVVLERDAAARRARTREEEERQRQLAAQKEARRLAKQSTTWYRLTKIFRKKTPEEKHAAELKKKLEWLEKENGKREKLALKQWDKELTESKKALKEYGLYDSEMPPDQMISLRKIVQDSLECEKLKEIERQRRKNAKPIVQKYKKYKYHPKLPGSFPCAVRNWVHDEKKRYDLFASVPAKFPEDMRARFLDPPPLEVEVSYDPVFSKSFSPERKPVRGPAPQIEPQRCKDAPEVESEPLGTPERKPVGGAIPKRKSRCSEEAPKLPRIVGMIPKTDDVEINYGNTRPGGVVHHEGSPTSHIAMVEPYGLIKLPSYWDSSTYWNPIPKPPRTFAANARPDYARFATLMQPVLDSEQISAGMNGPIEKIESCNESSPPSIPANSPRNVHPSVHLYEAGVVPAEPLKMDSAESAEIDLIDFSEATDAAEMVPAITACFSVTDTAKTDSTETDTSETDVAEIDPLEANPQEMDVTNKVPAIPYSEQKTPTEFGPPETDATETDTIEVMQTDGITEPTDDSSIEKVPRPPTPTNTRDIPGRPQPSSSDMLAINHQYPIPNNPRRIFGYHPDENGSPPQVTKNPHFPKPPPIHKCDQALAMLKANAVPALVFPTDPKGTKGKQPPKYNDTPPEGPPYNETRDNPHDFRLNYIYAPTYAADVYAGKIRAPPPSTPPRHPGSGRPISKPIPIPNAARVPHKPENIPMTSFSDRVGVAKPEDQAATHFVEEKEDIPPPLPIRTPPACMLMDKAHNRRVAMLREPRYEFPPPLAPHEQPNIPVVECSNREITVITIPEFPAATGPVQKKKGKKGIQMPDEPPRYIPVAECTSRVVLETKVDVDAETRPAEEQIEIPSSYEPQYIPMAECSSQVVTVPEAEAGVELRPTEDQAGISSQEQAYIPMAGCSSRVGQIEIPPHEPQYIPMAGCSSHAVAAPEAEAGIESRPTEDQTEIPSQEQAYIPMAGYSSQVGQIEIPPHEPQYIPMAGCSSHAVAAPEAEAGVESRPTEDQTRIPPQEQAYIYMAECISRAVVVPEAKVHSVLPQEPEYIPMSECSSRVVAVPKAEAGTEPRPTEDQVGITSQEQTYIPMAGCSSRTVVVPETKVHSVLLQEQAYIPMAGCSSRVVMVPNAEVQAEPRPAEERAEIKSPHEPTNIPECSSRIVVVTKAEIHAEPRPAEEETEIPPPLPPKQNRRKPRLQMMADGTLGPPEDPDAIVVESVVFLPQQDEEGREVPNRAPRCLQNLRWNFLKPLGNDRRRRQ